MYKLVQAHTTYVYSQGRTMSWMTLEGARARRYDMFTALLYFWQGGVVQLSSIHALDRHVEDSCSIPHVIIIGEINFMCF